jgi:hypothetical protein
MDLSAAAGVTFTDFDFNLKHADAASMQCDTTTDGHPLMPTCSGTSDFDLAAHSVLEILYQVGDANHELCLVGTDRSRFEFEFKTPCPNGIVYQSYEGAQIGVSFHGSQTAGIVLDPSNTFIEIGQCDGCSMCSVFTRLQIDPPVNITISNVLLSVPINRAQAMTAAQYTWAATTAMRGSATQACSW